MKVKVFIKDCLTKEVIRNNEVSVPEYSAEQMSEFHKKFERKYPNAHVNFTWKPKNCKSTCFICGVPLNMMLDEILLTDEEYTAKWYGDILNENPIGVRKLSRPKMAKL